MRGEVIQYDQDLGLGFIQGSDGRRYAFKKSDLRRMAPLVKGTNVEFQPVNDRAREIFVVRAQHRPAGRPSVTSPAQQPLPGTPSQSSRFGRFAEPAPSSSLWGYFIRGLTTNYARFSGRARRKEYWGYYLFWLVTVALLVFAGFFIDAAIGNLDGAEPATIAAIVLPTLFVIATALPSIAITVRRIHDIGLTGWLYLLILVPSVGGLIIFVFSLIPSQKHENKWGPVPEGIPVPEPVAVSPPAT